MKYAFMNKNNLSFLKLVLIIVSAILFSSNVAISQSMPPFKMQLANGTVFSSKNLSHEKPVLIIYFSPDCEHCQVLMNAVFKNIKDFKKAQIVMVTFKPLNEVIAFQKNYQTAKYPNIKVGIDMPIFFFKNYFNLQNTPFTALYNKQGKLIASYKNETPVNDLIRHLKGL
jgi:cytochrome oxidase Cu insertion factor (SCO1/SenC/PrrC family)